MTTEFILSLANKRRANGAVPEDIYELAQEQVSLTELLAAYEAGRIAALEQLAEREGKYTQWNFGMCSISRQLNWCLVIEDQTEYKPIKEGSDTSSLLEFLDKPFTENWLDYA